MYALILEAPYYVVKIPVNVGQQVDQVGKTPITPIKVVKQIQVILDLSYAEIFKLEKR